MFFLFVSKGQKERPLLLARDVLFIWYTRHYNMGHQRIMLAMLPE